MYKYLSIFIILFLPYYAICQRGIVSTICGNGTSIDFGDGGPATGATITAAGFGIFDVFGNYYFAQGPANRIRKIDTAGILSVAVGTGAFGFSGDGGQATSATLRNLKQFATDRFGNLYIADEANQRIRKVEASTGIITTIAGNGTAGYTGNGGQATAAELYDPYAVCIDPHGNIYIGEEAYNVIRKIDTNGIITLFAGTPGVVGISGDGGPATAATLASIQWLSSDTFGNIYVSAGNVRKINASTGIITRIAGNSLFSGYTGDSTRADTSAISNPYAMGFDRYGALYLAERDNNRIRKIDTNGFLYNVVGNGIAGFSSDGGIDDTTRIYWPEGIAFDACGNLYFNDLMNFRIRKVTFDSTCTLATLKTTNIAESKDINLYPNPTSHILSISYSEAINSVVVYDMVGKIVIDNKYNSINSVDIDVRRLKRGVYVVRVNGGEVRVNGGEVRRFVVSEP